MNITIIIRRWYIIAHFCEQKMINVVSKLTRQLGPGVEQEKQH
jgi:hypothetical protein